jgi:hypothetical protein
VTTTLVTFVSMLRATTPAPGTTPPDGSTTRPLILAESMVCCADANGAVVSRTLRTANIRTVDTGPST